MKGSFSLLTRSPEETRIVGASLASVVVPGDVVSLSGDLGSGKTVFVQGLAASLGVNERVTSPTFTIHQQYRGRYTLSHVDVYRLDSFQEVLDLGLEELLGSSILVVEWGDAIAPLLPVRRLEVRLEIVDETRREITLKPGSGDWVGRLESAKRTADALLGALAHDLPETSGEPAGAADPVPTRDDRTPAEEPDAREEDEKD